MAGKTITLLKRDFIPMSYADKKENTEPRSCFILCVLLKTSIVLKGVLRNGLFVVLMYAH